MKRVFAFCVCIVLLWGHGKTASAGEAELPRILVMHLAGEAPNLDKVLPIFKEQLAILELEIDPVGLEVAEFPNSDKGWIALAERTAEDAQIVATAAYECNDRSTCNMTLVMLRSQAIVKLSYPRPRDVDAQAFATAVTLREIVTGPLIGELKRLAEESRAPKPAKKIETGLLKSPFESTRHINDRRMPRWLWLEGAYQGDCAYPAGRPINGVSLGVDFEPSSMLGLMLQVGWIGMERAEAEDAEVLLHRLNAMFTVRMIFSLGPARIGIGAIGRLDTVFLSVHNAADFGSSKDAYLEASAGGITTWHLPLRWGLNFVIGAGLTASVLSREVEAVGISGSQETVIPASTLRMIWTVGLELSPSAAPPPKPSSGR